MKKTFISLAFLPLSLVFAQDCLAASLASDNAGNYPGGTWTPSTNYGTGFGAWSFSTLGSSGYFIGATGLGTDPSFGLWANDSVASAIRPFTSGALSSGQSFSVDINHTTGVAQGAGQNVGLNLLDSSGLAVLNLKFSGGNTNWSLWDGGSNFNIAQGYAPNQVLTFTFTYEGGNDYSYSFGSASGSNYTATSNLSSISGVQFYNDRQGINQNVGFDNLTVIPEPTHALVAVLCAAGFFLRPRRT
jgi:hypothetical protein